jgi:transposase
MQEPNKEIQIAQLRDAVRKQIGHSREKKACYRAFCLLMILQGQRISDIAEALGEHTRTIERWRKRFNEHGLEGLLDDTSPGRPARLSESAMASVAHDLQSPPSSFGIDGNQWRGRQLQQHLQRNYQVELSLRQCQRLLKRLNSASRPPDTLSATRGKPPRKDALKLHGSLA